MTTGKPRIFLGTTEIAGYYTGLYKGFRALGVPVSWYFRQPHKFHYSRRPISELLLQTLSKWFRGASEDARRNNVVLSRVPALEDWLVRRIINNHDIFIFGFMTSLDGLLTGGPRMRDLKRLKKLGKTVICVFHGSDVRPPWLNGNFVSTDPAQLARRGTQALGCLREIEKYADVIISHPPMAPLQVRPYAQYLCVGIPMLHVSADQQPRTGRKPGAVRIVHAPSNPAAKGTAQIEAVIARLRSEGYAIELKLLTGVSNAQVLRTLRDADLLIDQVYSDTPMAHLAAEAATQGCPSVVCGYDLKPLRDIVPPWAWPPTIIGAPDELYDRVKWALDHEAERSAIGRAAQAFVTQQWRPEQVARNLLRLAADGIPDEWLLEPGQRRFWGGYGMTLDQRDKLVERVAAVMGRQTMGLPDGIQIPLPRP